MVLAYLPERRRHAQASRAAHHRVQGFDAQRADLQRLQRMTTPPKKSLQRSGSQYRLGAADEHRCCSATPRHQDLTRYL